MKDATARSDGQVAPESIYNRDYYAWIQEQAKALRERRADGLDWENLREEVEDLGKGVRSELRNRFKLILLHLLKWEYQPQKRSRSWEGTLAEQRSEAQGILSENPSLQPDLAKLLNQAYGYAMPAAASEMGLSKREWQRMFPPACPWSVTQVLDEDFVPSPSRARSR